MINNPTKNILSAISSNLSVFFSDTTLIDIKEKIQLSENSITQSASILSKYTLCEIANFLIELRITKVNPSRLEEVFKM